MAIISAQGSRNCADETLCGDQIGIWHLGSRVIACLVDGLGHGPQAFVAATTALNCIANNLEAGCERQLQLCHQELMSTRGAALAVVLIDRNERTIQLASVGNVRAVVRHGDRERRISGARGIVGSGQFEVHVESFAFGPGDVAALFSDGIEEHVHITDSATVDGRLDDRLVAKLIAEFGKANDDVSLVMLRWEAIHRGLI